MRKLIGLLMVAIILVSAVAVFTTPTSASSSTVVRVEPSEIHKWSDVDSVGDTFTISIIAENVENFYGWEFIVSWTAGVINCLSEEINTGIWPYYQGPWVTDPIDNDKGEYHQSLTAKAPSEPVSGTFWLVNLTFEIAAPAPYGDVISTPIEVVPAPGYTAYVLLDPAGDEIPHDYVQGAYYYHWAPPTVLPYLEVVDPVDGDNKVELRGVNIKKSPETFDVEIYIRDVDAGWRLAGIQFILRYDTTLLDVLDVSQGDFLEPFTTQTWFYSKVFEDEGFVRVAYIILDIPGMTAPYGEGKVATITFNATKQEKAPTSLSCNLTLEIDTEAGMGSFFINYLAEELDYEAPINGTYIIYGYVVGRVIDVFTQYPTPYGGQGVDAPSDMFWPQQEVILYAYVTYNEWPEQNKHVTFQIIDPQGKIWGVLDAWTNSTGYAVVSFRLPWPCDDPEAIFGEWTVIGTVDVAGSSVNDTLTFYYDYLIHIVSVEPDKTLYKHDEDIYVAVTIKSRRMQKLNVTLAITVVDETGVPFGYIYTQIEIGGASYGDYKVYGPETLSVHVEKYARAGTAKIHVVVLNDFPMNGGTAISGPFDPIPIEIAAEWA